MNGAEGQDLRESVEECQAKAKSKHDTGFFGTLFKK